ncbi:tetratricopeptide repeat protein [uncultured Porphyromonas sp.]|uniref:tetratricopeptide repeat protein n=1 Tax=uncultured Porphyromonas sp. TaxID=159274 RepID=UPI002620602C|nr:tetratricopeptide repeat protein [uncultured Porphyromonas sp.]
MNYKGFLYTLLLCGNLPLAYQLQAQETFSIPTEQHAIEVTLAAGSPLRTTTLLSSTRRLSEGDEWFATYGAHLLGRPSAAAELEEYITTDPISRPAQIARIARATHYLYNKEYNRARHTLEQVRELTLTREVRSEWQVKMAYALLLSGRSVDQVERLFEMTIADGDYWGDVARLYLAQLYIAQNSLDKAEQTLLPIQDQGDLQYDARLGLAKIALYRQNYQSVLTHTEALATARLSEEQRTESQIIEANAWYRLEEPGKAIERLAPLSNQNASLLTPEDQLILAAAYMETERTEQAIPHLLLATRGDAETSGVANLYLARARRDMGLYSEALASYRVAADRAVAPTIREAAMYEQVLLMRSRASGSFGQEVRLCEEFLNTFAQSTHREAMEHFLIESYYRSPDYLTSLASIGRIQRPSPVIVEAQCYLLNQLTQQAQQTGDLALAQRYNQQAQQLGTRSAHQTEAELLGAQLLSQQGAYRQAAQALTAILNKRAASSKQLQIARYLLGYSQIKQQQYSAATQTLSILLQEGALENTLQADVYARLGDAHYMQGHYTPAVRYYEEAYRLAPDNQAYALYMLSDIEGLKKDYKAQIAALDKLVARHPNSLYKPRAMYDQGRAMELSGQHAEAIGAFTRLAQEYPQSEYGRKAALQLALLYYNRNETSRAIETYKALLAEAPQSGEAKQAYEALKSIYIEEGRSTEFVQYANSIGGSYAINESEAMSISFETAERAYQSRQPQAERLLKEYLALNPQGASSLLAHYYLGDLYERAGKEADALALYERIYPSRKQLSQELHIGLLQKMSAIRIHQRAYAQALPLQQELLTLPLEPASYQTTLLSATESALQAGQYEWVIKVVTPQLDKAKDWSQEQLDLLTCRLATSYLKTGRGNQVESLLKPLVARIETYAGTQGTLLLAQYYVSNKLQQSYSKQLLDKLVNEAYPDPELSAETIITLSDWYLAKGDPDTARLYLESLLKNYTDETSPIRQRAAEKLAQLRQSTTR